MRRLLFIALLSLPLVAEAAGAPKNLRELADQFIALLGAATETLGIVAFVVYLWGMVYDFYSLNKGEVSPMKQYYLWGLIILFVMSSIWGILRLVQATIFNGQPGGSTQQAKPCTDWVTCGPNA